MTELNKLYNKMDIIITEALKGFAAMPVNDEADKALNFKYKKDETEQDTIFEDLGKAKNKLTFIKGFAGLFSGRDECKYVCYKALSMIFEKTPSGRTGYMQVFTYKNESFWILYKNEGIVFSLPKIINEYPVKYDNKRIVLKKSGNLKHGANKLADIKWYEFIIEGEGIDTKEVLGGDYDKVAFMFTKITQTMIDSLLDSNIVNKGVSQIPRVNVDANTGNIHPKSEDIFNYNKIRQLVLFNGRGPLTLQFVEHKDYYIYSAVHKACYYPLINEDDKENKERLMNDNRYKFLEAVWKALPPEIKEEN